MNIDVLKLQKIFNIVCEKYIEINGEHFNSDIDFFWHIPLEDAIKFDKEPTEICVGSMEEDYKALEEILKGRSVNILDLERISNMFNLISFETDRSNDKFL